MEYMQALKAGNGKAFYRSEEGIEALLSQEGLLLHLTISFSGSLDISEPEHHLGQLGIDPTQHWQPVDLPSSSENASAATTEVSRLQKSIQQSAEDSPLPRRFLAHAVAGQPVMRIEDTATGLFYDVPLFAYKQVRMLLHTFFGSH